MLVLSRKLGERISIGGKIDLTVLSIRKGRVKLGFSGPSEAQIHRHEVVRRNGKERATAMANEEE